MAEPILPSHIQARTLRREKLRGWAIWLLRWKQTMLLARTKTWLMVLAVWTSGAAAVFAQPAEPSHWSPFGPSSIRYDLELFKPPDLSTYGDERKPAEGIFFQYERLYWSIQQPSRTDVGVPGGRATGMLNGVNNFDPTTQPSSDLLVS